MNQSIVDALTGLSNSNDSDIKDLKKVIVSLINILLENKIIKKREYNKILKML